jgi:hypothetical protein
MSFCGHAAGVRKLAVKRMSSVWERLRASYGVAAQDLAALDDLDLLLRACEVSAGRDVYAALPEAARATVGAPAVSYHGHVTEVQPTPG